MDKLKAFENICKNNAFSKGVRQRSSIELYDMMDRLSFYFFRSEYRQAIKDNDLDSLIEDDNLHAQFANKIFERVPAFQRDNDKWDSEMQTKFVLNLLKGCQSNPVVLYTLTSDITECFILDGLQRLTAIHRFLIKKDMVFELGNGETINSKAITDASYEFWGMRNIAFDVKIYQFDNELQAVNHYIDINDGITHSQKDINRAKAYRDSLIRTGMKA